MKGITLDSINTEIIQQRRPSWSSLALAIVGALLLAGLFHVRAFGSWQGFHEGIDLNKNPFEDFMGPYINQAVAIRDGRGLEEGYLYPPTLAILMWPLASMSPSQAAWAWLAVLSLASVALYGIGLLWLGCLRPSFVFWGFRVSSGVAA